MKIVIKKNVHFVLVSIPILANEYFWWIQDQNHYFNLKMNFNWMKKSQIQFHKCKKDLNSVMVLLKKIIKVKKK